MSATDVKEHDRWFGATLSSRFLAGYGLEQTRGIARLSCTSYLIPTITLASGTIATGNHSGYDFAQSPLWSQLFLKTQTAGYYMVQNANQLLYS